MSDARSRLYGRHAISLLVGSMASRPEARASYSSRMAAGDTPRQTSSSFHAIGNRKPTQGNIVQHGKWIAFSIHVLSVSGM
jgi:hypothetical protein